MSEIFHFNPDTMQFIVEMSAPGCLPDDIESFDELPDALEHVRSWFADEQEQGEEWREVNPLSEVTESNLAQSYPFGIVVYADARGYYRLSIAIALRSELE